MTLGIKTVIATAIISLIAVIGTLAVPTPATFPGTDTAFHVSFMLSTLMATAHVIAAVLFFIGIRVYKAKLRLAYSLIALGTVLIGLGTLQLPIIDAFNLSETIWVKGGFVILPFLLSGLIVYMGVRKFALLVGLASKLNRAILVIPGVIAVSILSTWLPHASINRPEVAHDASNAILVWTMALYFCTALLAFKLRSHVGSHYVNAIAWLAVGFVGAVLITALSLINNSVFNSSDLLESAVNVLGVLNGLILIKAGHAFNMTKDY